MSSATQTAYSFNKILNQPKLTSKSRQAGNIDEAVKKLRRLILVEGIPSAVVSLVVVVIWSFFLSTVFDRIRHYDLVYGRSFYM